MSEELKINIPLNFGLFWSGSKLSYLRYLTFVSLRHFHPDSTIDLYVSSKCVKDGYKWANEKQDFEIDIGEDYTERLKDLGVVIHEINDFAQYQPNFQSDFFRWWYLKEFGGFYLDTDQIILKSFNGLPLYKNLIYSAYGPYFPVGVIGASKISVVVKRVNKVIKNHYNPNDYNSLGPWMFRDVMKSMDIKEGYNAPKHIFYPINFSHDVNKIYSGKFEVPDGSRSLHWFGGHPLSQKFNKAYSEEMLKTSNDTISRWCRDNEIF